MIIIFHKNHLFVSQDDEFIHEVFYFLSYSFITRLNYHDWIIQDGN